MLPRISSKEAVLSDHGLLMFLRYILRPLYSFLVEFIFDSKIEKVDVNPTSQTKSH